MVVKGVEFCFKQSTSLLNSFLGVENDTMILLCILKQRVTASRNNAKFSTHKRLTRSILHICKALRKKLFKKYILYKYVTARSYATNSQWQIPVLVGCYCSCPIVHLQPNLVLRFLTCFNPSICIWYVDITIILLKSGMLIHSWWTREVEMQ